jgi:hypothetical protein
MQNWAKGTLIVIRAHARDKIFHSRAIAGGWFVAVCETYGRAARAHTSASSAGNAITTRTPKEERVQNTFLLRVQLADLAPFAFSSVICQRARNILQLARFISARCRTRSFLVMRANRKFQMIRGAREPNSICVMDNAQLKGVWMDLFWWKRQMRSS